MARLILPEDFESQFKLAKLISDKHTADGATSRLNVYLAEQGINLATIVADGTIAEGLEAQRAQKARDSEKFSKLRNNIFIPIFKDLMGGVQSLKTIFKPNYHKLGDWGVTVNGVSRIVYPPRFTQRAALVGLFYGKHNSYPAGTSPLQPYINEQGINTALIGVQVNEAIDYDNNRISTHNSSENFKQQRDMVWDPRWAQLKGCCNYLFRLLPNNPKLLGDWGITVDDSPRAPKLRKSKILLLETKTVDNVVIGSTFHNTGPTTLHIHKGASAGPAAVVVLPDERYGITKGWSTITVLNTDPLETGMFTTLAH
jgi:hypothetical protein